MQRQQHVTGGVTQLCVYMCRAVSGSVGALCRNTLGALVSNRYNEFKPFNYLLPALYALARYANYADYADA